MAKIPNETAPKRRRAVVVAGGVLIALSFLVYPAYGIIVFYVPGSWGVKFGIIVAAWILSWALFATGIILAGVETYDWLKELRHRRPRNVANE